MLPWRLADVGDNYGYFPGQVSGLDSAGRFTLYPFDAPGETNLYDLQNEKALKKGSSPPSTQI